MTYFQSILGFAVWVLIAFIAIVVYRSISSRTIVLLVVDNTGLVDCRGLSPRVKREIETFFQQDVQINHKVTIRGQLDHQRRLRCHFRGKVDAGTQQQIRNFLQSRL